MIDFFTDLVPFLTQWHPFVYCVMSLVFFGLTNLIIHIIKD